MEYWFSALTLFEKVYWIVALAGSAVLLILVARTFIVGDGSGDVDADVEGDGGIGLQFLSLKNLMGVLYHFRMDRHLYR